MVKQVDLSKLFNFPVFGDIRTALVELNTYKVNEIRNKDYSYQDSFAKVYFSVLHEVDMYEEGECEELSPKSYQATKRWLERWKYLSKDPYTGLLIDRWYDPHTKSWVIQKKDIYGNQIGDAFYTGNKQDAIDTEEQWKSEVGNHNDNR